MGITEEKTNAILKSLYSDSKVVQAFKDAYGDNGDKKFKKELNFLKSHILGASPKMQNSMFRAEGLSDCFVKLATTKGATLSPVIKHYQLFPSFGNKWKFDIGWRLFTHLILKNKDIISINCVTKRENDHFEGSMFSDDGIEYKPAPRDRGKIEYTILSITRMGAVREFREIDIKPAEYGEKRREASKSKGTWKDWEDEMFIKTHVKHFANNFLDTSESFIEIGDIMEDEFTYSENEETTTPALTIDAVKEANAVEKIVKTFDTEVIEPSEVDIICNTLEGWTADEKAFDEWYETVIKRQWKDFTTEEKNRITPLLKKVKDSFTKVTLDQIK